MKQLFIKACNESNPSILLSSLSKQQLKEKGKYFINSKCRFCKEAGIDDVYFTYWSGCWTPCHKACKSEGAKGEAYECQLIDADCNDCKHFKREYRTQGYCEKHDKPTKGYSNYASGYDCFVHRKDINANNH